MTVVIILTWLLIKFKLWIFLYVSVDSHLLYLSSKKTKTKFFLRDHKATQLFCVIPAMVPRVYIYIYIYIYMIVDLFKKLCKFFVYWVNFCDGERYLLGYSKLLFLFAMQWLPDGNVTLSSKTFPPFYDISNKVVVLFTELVKLSNMRISRH